jgi:hypothetical protein
VIVNGDSVLAYIDAGSAGYLLQLVIVAATGSLVSVMVFWRRLTGWFGGIFSRDKNGSDEDI